MPEIEREIKTKQPTIFVRRSMVYELHYSGAVASFAGMAKAIRLDQPVCGQEAVYSVT